MSTHDNGGPAFPSRWDNDSEVNATAPDGESVPPGYSAQIVGLSIRDYFAAKAMEAAATNPTGAEGFAFAERAAWAYQQADAMLRARASEPNDATTKMLAALESAANVLYLLKDEVAALGCKAENVPGMVADAIKAAKGEV